MSDPLKLIPKSAHLETSNREAFEVERAKFRNENLERLRLKFADHKVTYTDHAGNEKVGKSLGLKIILPHTPPKSIRVHVPVDLSTLPDDISISEYESIEFVADVNPLDPELKDLKRDVANLSISEAVQHLAPSPQTGPELESLSDEDIFEGMDKFITRKCGPDSIHPHLRKMKKEK